MTTARNRAIDRIRRDRTLAGKARLLDVPEAMEDDVDETTILVERLELDSYHYLHAARAELLRRLDRVEDARASYGRTRARALGCRAALPRAAAGRVALAT